MKQFALHIPEGVKDYVGEEAALKECIENKVKEIFRTNSYNMVETPSFEYLDVFTLGEETFQQPSLYHLVSRQGELMALKSDMTRSIARLVGTQKVDVEMPQRFGYLSNSFRYPERYQGKLHEFTQAGVELIGNKSLEADAEVIRVAVRCLQAAGLNDFRVHIGSGQFLEYILKDLSLDEACKMQVLKAIEKKDAVQVKEILKGAPIATPMVEVLIELIQCAGQVELLKRIKAKIPSLEAKKALEEMEQLYQLLEADGVNEKLIFDFSLMSYGQYYTGMMFQIFTLGIGSALVEGGRYDTLLERFGRNLPAVGFGMHINLVLQHLIQVKGLHFRQAKRTLAVCTPMTYQICQEASEILRKRGQIVENSLMASLEENLSYAKKRGMARLLYFKEGKQVDSYEIATDSVERLSVDQL